MHLGMLLLPPGRRDGLTGVKGDFGIFCGAQAKRFGALVKIANLVTRTYFSLVSFLNFRYLHFTRIFLLVISLQFHTHNCLRFGLFGFGSFKSRKKTNKLCTEAMKVFQVNGSSLSLALFTDVMNSKELLNLMQAGTLEPEVAFLNASLIPDVFPLLAAAHKTLLTKSRGSLTTRTLHSELVYNYSGSKHITESLKRCGISETCTYVLVAIFNASFDQMQAAEKLIKGNEIDLEELEIRANKPQIQKHYKITVPELGISSLADAIACRIAARDAL